MKVFINYLIVLFCFFATVQCSNRKLTNEKALNAIVREEQYPKPVSYEFNSKYLKDFHKTGRGATYNKGPKFDDVKNLMLYYEKNGLVTIKEETKSETSTSFLIGTTTRTWTYAVIRLTEKGNKYLMRKTDNGYVVKIWDNDISQITGIQIFKEANSASVEYSVSHVNITPFGEVFKDKNSIINRTATFSLYEDGWRIE